MSHLIPPPPGNPGAFDQNHARRARICPHKLSQGAGIDKGCEVTKIQHAGLISTQNPFFGIHTEYETEFAFSFKNSEVCSNVL